MMTINGILQIALFVTILLATTVPLGAYMAKVFAGERTIFQPVFGPVERWLYRLFGVREEEDMRWTTYAYALLAFSLVGLLLTYALLRFQGVLPLNPQGFGTAQMTPDLALNTAISFTTNTNWQNYVPETTLSYFSNMVALAIHNWMSAATGIAVALALTRGIARRSAAGIGNFWVDVTRATLYVLLPISLVFAMVLVWQGVPQNFEPYVRAVTSEGGVQSIAQGPVASQEVIKMLGTNGGGFFNTNSAHPYENPTPLTNLIEMLLIFLIPTALCYTFGRMVGNVRQGWAIFAAMGGLFLVGVFVCYGAEAAGNPLMQALGVPGGNMEGKEVRFGTAASALFATVTTAASCGAVNAMHDSFTPIGGLVPLFNMMTGEVIFGGVGAGLYGMLMFAFLAVFIAGLMVGRTPEYIGKKIEGYEVKMAMLATLVLAASILGFTAVGANLELPKEPETSAWARFNRWPGGAYGGSDTLYGATYNNVNNGGPHGFTEILYAYSSATGNNGSAFAGLTGNTPFYNLTLGLAMLIGRFLMIIPLLAIAGSLARKKFVPPSAGTFPTDGATFVGLLIGVVLIIGALTYLPALALGPIVEHFRMSQGLSL
ncbi:MAG: potassium-transporting ATPase subunit KdpA [Capsulimonadales bacterium]|nr:potassium-transporting ATPase subunit KdpA [Capsulimonadales bacterium]